jgi:two-component system OmpR family sensor kinase
MATDLEVSLRHSRPIGEWEATGRNSLEELRRLSTVVEGLLTLARAGADAPDSRAGVDLVESIDAVIAQLTDRADSAGVSLSGPVDGASAHTTGNAVMIETAVRNLIANAITAVPRGGHVRVNLETQPTDIVITVDDDGPGLGPNPEALFAPFRRGSAERAEGAARGIGLGLAIARRVAVAHGGSLTAAERPNRRPTARASR